MPPPFRAAPVRVRVPATSANLGPGFDAFGLALGRYDEVRVEVTAGGLTVDVTGEGASTVSRTGDNLVVRALRAAFDVLGGQPAGLRLHCTNRIPHGRGLGSSAAAICAGVVAARALVHEGAERLDAQATLALATEIEGHPDNVAACLAGGFTLAWTTADGPRAVRLDPAATVVPVAFVPAFEVSTAKARGLLPATVPHADAAANAGRAALFVEALTRRPDLLLPATEDRLHQRYREPAMPESAALVDKLRSAGVPAVVSGAGPTVLALAGPDTAEEVTAGAGQGWRAWRPGVDRDGAKAEPAG
jgi:homoserine kinase